MVKKASRVHVFKDPTFLTRLLIGLLLVSAIVALLASWSGWQQSKLLEDVLDGATLSDSEAHANDDRQAKFGLAQIGTTVLAGIVFMIWTYRVVANALASSRYTMQTSPGWAVGYYFIPILNIWKPFQAIRDADAINARQLRQRSNAVLIGGWWLLWLIAGVLNHFVSRVEDGAGAVRKMLDLSNFEMVSDLVDFALGLVTVFMVFRIGRASAAIGSTTDESEVFA